MNDQQFRQLIEASEVFKNFPVFKQRLILNHLNLARLKDYHHQAEKYGIGYLKQNPNLSISDVALIDSLI